MKVLKYIVLVIACATALTVSAQSKADKKVAQQTAIKAMVDNQRFDFVAQYVTPQGGGRRYLTSTYDLKVRKDSVIAYLPYFGQAYFDVPYNPTDGGIKFTSTKFSYKVTPKKKGGWDVLIEPADSRYYQKLYFSISPNGNASLSMNITNRSFISFDGYVEAPEKRKD
ncbi:DUF4251 domain-containing protein [Mucilaginibacter ginkgonis]|uniref:DUF4251 domain-containing protein n=1 Tax=Mucilaginibacter ginkgonis TaxID=2682091 RepID=A0A6I4IN79_9SPHI|nr:DUF4251 domain-containing protein [Mucilaginibacter ginkgonis]QQL51333.1 DUF4251 domain-containing protein [Mucilaginibacter ginkgonis]